MRRRRLFQHTRFTRGLGKLSTSKHLVSIILANTSTSLVARLKVARSACLQDLVRVGALCLKLLLRLPVNRVMQPFVRLEAEHQVQGYASLTGAPDTCAGIAGCTCRHRHHAHLGGRNAGDTRVETLETRGWIAQEAHWTSCSALGKVSSPVLARSLLTSSKPPVSTACKPLILTHALFLVPQCSISWWDVRTLCSCCGLL